MIKILLILLISSLIYEINIKLFFRKCFVILNNVNVGTSISGICKINDDLQYFCYYFATNDLDFR